MNAPAALPLAVIPTGHDRQKFLGGSDVAAIFGVSPWKTPYDLWADKIRPRVDEPQLDPKREKFFKRRKRQEPVIAEMLADEYGIVVTRLSLDEDPNRYRDAEFPFMAAEIDFEFLMSPAVREAFPGRPEFGAIPDGTLLNGEIKTVHPFKASEWGEEGTEEVPVHYAAQVMHGLGVTRKPAALVAALFGLDLLVCFPVMADPETIAAMRAKSVHFWNYHVMQRIPPDPVNVADVTSMYSKFSGRSVELSPEAYKALKGIAELREQAKQMKLDLYDCEWAIARCVAINWGVDVVDRSEKKNEVKLDVTSPENARLMYGEHQVGSWNRQRGTYLDQRRLAIEKPEIIAGYTLEHFYRAIRVKK